MVVLAMSTSKKRSVAGVGRLLSPVIRRPSRARSSRVTLPLAVWV
jgi:hypothetical protein